MLLKSESCRQVFHSQEPIQAAICRGRGPSRPPSITCDHPGRGDEAGPFRPLHCNGLEFALVTTGPDFREGRSMTS